MSESIARLDGWNPAEEASASRHRAWKALPVIAAGLIALQLAAAGAAAARPSSIWRAGDRQGTGYVDSVDSKCRSQGGTLTVLSANGRGYVHSSECWRR
ncbi:hypothetical protein QFZ66_001135 [Streptomyces sp. B4I13]|uniref:hypothetical protein n=1 Tax=Streptomyces sp. B4I13 TaxID=3042271 RepID=UPI002788ABB6|nr:hypothetical protein [Streptomyces sp. B4I13]MDQ0957257.1 hypothetical protein [Streptomyces sp. B4I13]